MQFFLLHVNDTFQYRGITYSIVDVNARTVRVGTGIDSGELPNAVKDTYGPDLLIPNFVSYGDTIFSVTEVGVKAFRSCWNLRTIQIGFCIEIVRIEGFARCRNVTSITFDPNSRLQIIEDGGFYDFYAVQSITFNGNNLTQIGDCAFCFAWALKSITIPPSVTKFGHGSFKGLDILQEFQYCGNTAITSDVFLRDNFNGHSTPASIAVKVTSSYPSSRFATDTVRVDNSLKCNYPKAITYNLVCKSNRCRHITPEFSSFLVFIFM